MAFEKVRYARSRDGSRLAWIESGKGPMTLLIAPNAITHIVDDWTNPLRRCGLSAYSEAFRVVRFDDRGFGCSSRGAEYGVELWADDIEAVADAAGLTEPFVLLGQSVAYGALTFAARAPERLSHLLICGGKANGAIASGIPEVIEVTAAHQAMRRTGWNQNDPLASALSFAYLANDLTEEDMRFFSSRKLSDIADVADVVRYDEATARADTRPILGSIRTPTLVGHARGDRAVDIGLGRRLARDIPGATFVELDTENHALRERDGGLQAWMGHVRDFVYGARNSADPASELSERERDILDGLCDGLTNDAIAARLGISEKTVRNHLTQVFEKIGVATRTQAVIAAMSRR